MSEHLPRAFGARSAREECVRRLCVPRVLNFGSQNRWISITPIYIGIPFVNGSHDPLGLTAVTPRKNEATGTKTDRSPSSEGVVAVSAAQELHKTYIRQHSRCVRAAFGSRKVRSEVIHFHCTGSLRFSNYPIHIYIRFCITLNGRGD